VMMDMKWIILILGVLSNAAASTLIKVAMTYPRPPLSFAEPLSILTNWPLWAGVILYGVAFVLYALSLAHLPLSVAHPILTSGSIALVVLASMFLFGEQLTLINLIGIALIMLGVAALAFY